MKILISGSSGFVGSMLTEELRRNRHVVTRLVRHRCQGTDEFRWDPEANSIDKAAFDGTDAVIHLAGSNIAAQRWTESARKEIMTSRIKGTTLLCQTMSRLKNPPRVLVSASGVGFYGNRGDTIVDERCECGRGFLADVARQWETATATASQAGIRVANIRLGMILGKNGGALAKMLLPFKLGLGCIVGSGAQYISWITTDDVAQAAMHIINNQEIAGPLNLATPNPTTNSNFSITLGRVLHRPVFMKAPAFILSTLLGEMADDLLLSSTRAIPAKLTESGYTFRYPELEPALMHILE